MSTTLHFIEGDGIWDASIPGFEFRAIADTRPVTFVIPSSVLGAMIGRGKVNARLGKAIFIEFGSDLRRIAGAVYGRRSAGNGRIAISPDDLNA